MVLELHSNIESFLEESGRCVLDISKKNFELIFHNNIILYAGEILRKGSTGRSDKIFIAFKIKLSQIFNNFWVNCDKRMVKKKNFKNTEGKFISRKFCRNQKETLKSRRKILDKLQKNFEVI